METIGDRIRRRRKELKMSQDELAQKLGYKSRSSVNKMELNWRNLTQSKIKLIADALDTTPSWIMGWEDNLTKKNAGAIVDLLASEELMEYTKKLSALDIPDRKMVYDLIDRLAEK